MKDMILVVVLIVLAIAFGVGGLIAHALWWLFVIAAILFIAGIFAGVGRGRRMRV